MIIYTNKTLKCSVCGKESSNLDEFFTQSANNSVCYACMHNVASEFPTVKEHKCVICGKTIYGMTEYCENCQILHNNLSVMNSVKHEGLTRRQRNEYKIKLSNFVMNVYRRTDTLDTNVLHKRYNAVRTIFNPLFTNNACQKLLGEYQWFMCKLAMMNAMVSYVPTSSDNSIVIE